MARLLSNSEARRIQQVVETVERQSVNKLPPKQRTWRPSSGGGDSGPLTKAPCSTCWPRFSAGRVTLPDGTKAAQAYETTAFNTLFGVPLIRFVHLEDGEYVADEIIFEC